MQLGSTQPSAPLPPREAVPPGEAGDAAEAAARPQTLPRGAIDDEDADAGAPGYDEPVDLRPPARTGAIPAARPSESVAATRTGDPAADYDAAVELVRGKQYEQAEMGLRQFIQSHPRDNRVAGATYWLGESYLARGRNREAAEQFLKVSTDYARSAQAPDAMLKLGVTLNALGPRAGLRHARRTRPEVPECRRGRPPGRGARTEARPLRRLSGPDDPKPRGAAPDPRGPRAPRRHDGAAGRSGPAYPRPWLGRSAGPVLLAVSGGPDSSALMQAAAALGGAVQVATVDHGLRPGSGAEADAVGRAAARLGLPHATLRWAGSKPGRGLQEAARTARYALLCAHAEAIGAGLVLTGHTRDDQAETVLMRLAAGSGTAGLAGMRAERVLAPGIVLGRPFLHLPKAILTAWCEARGIPYLRDPSNADLRFARGRLRATWPALEREGLTPCAPRAARRARGPRRGRARGRR